MKLLSIIFLVAVAVLGLYFYDQETTAPIQPTTTGVEKETSNISPSQMSILNSIAEKNGLVVNKASNVTNDVHQHSDADFDFKSHLTREQKLELYNITNRRHEGLVVEVDENGISTVDLKKRFSHAHVSVFKDGVKRTGEYAQTTKVE